MNSQDFMTNPENSKENKRKISDLFKNVENIKDDVNTILTILQGPGDTDKPSGLIYSVAQNTRFRKLWTKVIWIVLAANAGVLAWLLTTLLGG